MSETQKKPAGRKAAEAGEERASGATGMVALVATRPIQHDGVDYAEGAELAVDAAAAEALLTCGAATRA